MPKILLATFCLLPNGEEGGGSLVRALADRGVEAAWAAWDDAAVDWAAAEMVVVRSTWDYHRRCDDFLTWARGVEKQTRLLNGADVFSWNCDKSYLVDLGERVPVVPSSLVDDADLLAGLEQGLGRFGTVVVKSRIGASGVGVVVADRTDDPRLAGLTAGPWVIQPLVESVRTAGETSVFVMGGRAVSQIEKMPPAGGIRVHEQYGGVTRPVRLDDHAAAFAEAAFSEAASLLGSVLHYGRIDIMKYEDRLVVSEVELIEPGLYLDVVPANAEMFADLLADAVADGS